MTDRGEYVSQLYRWLRCPECGSENVSQDKGWDGELQLECRECRTWSSIV